MLHDPPEDTLVRSPRREEPVADATVIDLRDAGECAPAAAPFVSLVVPTRNEADNVEDFVRRASSSLRTLGAPFELLFVDDSDDDTPLRLARLRTTCPEIQVFHRPRGHRDRGLGGALLAGFASARGQVVTVMDADLQHPPEVLPALVTPLLDARIGLSIGTRYLAGGSAGGLMGAGRSFASRLARRSVHLWLPATRGVSDPCGGLFAVRRSVLQATVLQPDGFKILLEVLVRSDWRLAAEVPYVFQRRQSGTSNFGTAEIGRFGRHLLHLSLTQYAPAVRPRLAAAPPDVPSPRSQLPVQDQPVDDVRSDGPALTGTPPPGTREPGAGPRRRTIRVHTHRQPATRWLTWRAVRLFALLLFLLAQAGRSLLSGRGPFLDEGIYITAGARTLEGQGIADGYLGWFAGSLLWPATAGLAHEVGGLSAARLLAAVLVTAGAAGALHAARVLYGDRAAGLAALVLLTSAPALALGHLAVYDVIAVAGLGGCLASLAELQRTDHRRWLLLSALSFVTGVFGKYPLLFLLPAVIALLVVLRGRRARVEAPVFLLVQVGVLLSLLLPLRHQLAYFLGWRLDNDPSFEVTSSMIAYELVLLGGGAFAAAVAAVVLLRGPARRLALLLTATMLLFPAYHLYAGNSVGSSKHLLLGTLVAVPAVGAGLAVLAGSSRWRTSVVLVLVTAHAGLGTAHASRMDQSWADVTPGATYLAQHVQPGERLLIPNAWQVLPKLYGRAVTDPADLTDAYGWANGLGQPSVCHYEWFISTSNDNQWSEDVLADMSACGSFREVFSSTSRLENLTAELTWIEYASTFTVYRNTDVAS